MEVFLSKDVDESKRKVFKEVKSFIEMFDKRSIFYNIDKLSLKDDCQNSILQMMKSFAHKCESVSPGSLETFFSFLLEENNFKEKINVPSPLRKNNVSLLLESFSNSFVSSLVLDCLKLSGLEGKIILSKETCEDECLIEASSGCFFSKLVPAFKIDHQKYFDTKVVCVDGYVESVSEINRFLEDVAKEKEPVFLFVRGMSDDVLHTLKVNYDRKSLVVIPVITKFDLESINLLNDIAIASGSDVVSSLKGQLISCIEVKSAPRVSSIDVSPEGILIENSSQKARIDSHIVYLQTKILEESNSSVIEALTKRIQQLGTSRVTIKLEDNINMKKNALMIDRCLKAVKVASTYGVINHNGMIVLNILDYSKEVVRTNLAQANGTNALEGLTEDQLKKVVDIVDISLSQGFQKAIPAFQKSLDTLVTANQELVRKKK